jgi:hypothetical protein
MTEVHYYHKQLFILNSVDDPEIPDPKAIKVFGPFQFLDAWWARNLFKGINGVADPFSRLERKGFNLALRSREDEDSVFHGRLG